MSDIDRWRDDMLDGTSRAYRRASGFFDTGDVSEALKDTICLLEDAIQEIGRLRILLREAGIDD